MRSRLNVGIKRPTGDRVSRYSTITRESNTGVSPSTSRHGTLPSGLCCATMALGESTSSSTSVQSSFFSASTMRTLRTNGLVVLPISFINVVRPARADVPYAG